jgi:hypothetical protein
MILLPEVLATYNLLLLPIVTPHGLVKDVGEIVLIKPVAFISRITLLPLSAISRLPFEFIPTPLGLFNLAFMASPRSPLYPDRPVPANLVVSFVSARIIPIVLLVPLAKYMFPLESIVTPCGDKALSKIEIGDDGEGEGEGLGDGEGLGEGDEGDDLGNGEGEGEGDGEGGNVLNLSSISVDMTS